MQLSSHKFSLGLITLGTRDDRLCRLYLPHQEHPAACSVASPLHREVFGRLEQYFAGQLISFNDLPLSLSGTPFQQSIWQLLRTVPYGATRHYSQLGPARAVGAACRCNPLPLIIPCHRIIPKSGGVGFYAGCDNPLKAQLLQLENAHSHQVRITQHD